MAYAFVQQKDVTNASASSTSTGNFAASITAGNLIWVTCRVANGMTANTPTDTLGHTYTLIGSCTTTGISVLYHWYAKNTSAGTNSVSITTTGGPSNLDLWASEWSGFDTSAPLLGHNELWSNPASGSADSAVSGTATITLGGSPGAGVLGFDLDVNGRTHTNPGDEGTGFTVLANAFGGFGMPEHKRVTANGTYQATFDDPAFDQHLVVMAIFGETATAPTINTQPANARVFEDADATFTVSATASAGSLTYQWQEDPGTGFANISGATSASLTVNAPATRNGHLFRCNVTDSNGTTTTSSATLRVAPLPRPAGYRRKVRSVATYWRQPGYAGEKLTQRGWFSRDIILPLAAGGDATVSGQTLTATASLIPGSASGVQNATVSGQTLTATASLIPGAATGVQNATVSGQTLTATASLIPGAATGQVNATVSGQTLTATASLIPGAASGTSNATVNGQTLTATASVIPGSATGEQNATVSGQTLTATASLIPGAASGAGNATVNGQTLTATASLTAGAVTADSTAAGATLTATASLIPGSATGTGDATVNGQTLTATASVIPGGTQASADVVGQTLTAVASLLAGSAFGPVDATVNGQALTAIASLIPGGAFGPAAGGTVQTSRLALTTGLGV